MRAAIVGCGFVAELYMSTSRMHPEVELVGAMDVDFERAAKFSARHGLKNYKTLDDLLADGSVDTVLNLTNPRSHYLVTKACLEARKHVYSEKPLATDFEDAKRLVELSRERGLLLSGAPCNLLSETAQSMWKALRENIVGPVRVVYAEMDDGMMHRMPYRKWLNKAGTPWPWKDEFEVGCTLEHAGYYLTWLAAFFGPAETVTALSACQVADKQTDLPLDVLAPDFSVACIRFQSGIVARLTCSILAPHDHSLRIVGDEGVLSTLDSWFYSSPVRVQRIKTIRRRSFMTPWRTRYPLLKAPRQLPGRWGSAQMDFCRGVAEMALALAENRPPRLSADFSLHVNEFTLAIQNAGAEGTTYKLQTTFAPISPMPWAA